MAFNVITADYPVQFNTLVQTAEHSNRMHWKKWWLILTVIAIVYAITLDVAPFVHMDELLTVDLGRIMLHPDTDWSIAWIGERNQPAFFFFYLGPVLQELSYNVLGQYGPRIMALLGALTAATILVKWLLARGISGNNAILMALIFLLDPLFVQAYTLGRSDGLTLTLCMAACLLLEQAKQQSYSIRYSRMRTLFAGVLAAVAFISWPSAVFLFPLFLILLAQVTVQLKRDGFDWKTAFTPAAYFVIGALVTGVVLLVPVAPQLIAQLDNMIAGMKINSNSGPLFGEHTGFLNKIAPGIELLRVFKFSPLIVLVSVLSLIWNRNAGLAVALLSAMLLMLCTVVYIHRVLYLLPYLILATSEVYQTRKYAAQKRLSSPVQTSILFLLLFWCSSFSLFARTALAIKSRADNSRFIISRAAQTMLGPQNHSVLLLNTYEFYYTGRALGWKMYAPYASMGDSLTTRELQQILPHVDCAIVVNWKATGNLVQQLMNQGLHDKGLYYTYRNRNDADDGNVSNMERLRSLYRIVPQPYGPYRLFVRGLVTAPVATSK